MEKKIVNVPFDDQSRKTIRAAAGAKDISVSMLIRDAIKDKLIEMNLPVSKNLRDEK